MQLIVYWHVGEPKALPTELITLWRSVEGELIIMTHKSSWILTVIPLFRDERIALYADSLYRTAQ